MGTKGAILTIILAIVGSDAIASCPGSNQAERAAFIVAKTCRLPSGFDAGRVGDKARGAGPDDYRRPAACAASGQPTSEQLQVRGAFQLAGERFQDHLCDLHSIYFFTGAMQSWGFWEGDHQRAPDGSRVKFIGINLRARGAFHEEENVRMNDLLGTTWSGRPSLRSSTFGTNPRAALLAELAHEMGHIHWHEAVKRTANCYATALDRSWVTPVVTGSPRWQPYNVGYPSSGHESGVGGHIPTIKAGREAENASLRAIYSAGHFASLLGSATQEEDFVETYRLTVLYHARELPLRSLIVANAQSTDVDIVSALRDASTGLGQKANCVTRRPTDNGGLGLEEPL